MSSVTYHYRALDRSGSESRGTVAASSRDQAYRMVAESGLTLLALKPARLKRKRGRRRVGLREISQFTYQLQVLLEARIPVSEGLAGLAAQEENATFRSILLDIATQVEAGSTIAGAMEAHRKVLGDVYVETVCAAERSGTMSRTLEHLCEAMERMESSKRQVKGAMLYPICVSAVLIVAAGFLITYTIPKFAVMFEARGVELPLLTRLLAGFGESVRGYWWGYLLGLAGAVFGLRYVCLHHTRSLESLFHKIPAIRPILVGLAVSRFTRVFTVSLSAGLGLLEALEMGKRAAARRLLAVELDRMADEIRSGRRLCEGLEGATYIPSFARRMLVAGEQSGELCRMTEIVAKHYERETSHRIQTLTTVMEPLLVVAITSVVLVVALAIFMPMWNMVQLMG